MRNRKRARREGIGALEIIEEATHLLRGAPVRVLASYYVGSAAFVLGFLYFWADMSRGAYAQKHSAEAALSVSLLFLWMKCWQTVFCRQLLAQLGAPAREPWSLRRVLRLIAAQTAIQPTGFLLLPLALLITLPFGWAYAFYQNVTVLADGGAADLKAVVSRSGEQSSLFPRQNHVVLLVLSLFGLFVFLNMAAVLTLAPHLVQTLLGVETVFTRAGTSMFNTTFLAVTMGMTYLAVDPLVKTAYALRCYYGDSLRTGEDLKADLAAVQRPGRGGAAAVVGIAAVVIVFAHAAAAAGQPLPPVQQLPEQAVISAPELDRAISDVITKREYAWRLPREKQKEEAKKGPVAAFVQGVAETVKKWLAPVGRWFKKAFEWIIEKIVKRLLSQHGRSEPDRRWSLSIPLLLYVLLGAAASVLAVLFWRMWQRRRSRPADLTGETVPVTPDLTREDVAADELPVNRWLELGRDLLRQGDQRLALRAFFLASLSRLAEQRRITVAAFKSNREYEQELRRKSHELPDLVSAFAENRRLFDCVWYGMHDVTQDVLNAFNQNQARIMTNAEQA